jgi:hypothetical protein
MREAIELIRVWIPFVVPTLIAMVWLEWVGKRQGDSKRGEVIYESKPLHLGIIWLAESVAVLFVFGLTLVGAIMGSVSSGLASAILVSLGFELGNNPKIAAIVGAVIGGCCGFLTGALATSFLFAITAIEKNTRRTAAYLERLAQSKN